MSSTPRTEGLHAIASPRSDEVAALTPSRAEPVFCEHFITPAELGTDDAWSGTFCKLPFGHSEPHSPLYADERAAARDPRRVARMPRFKRWRCEEPGDDHDEAFACEECDQQVCGVHAEVNAANEWLCPDCFERELTREFELQAIGVDEQA